MERFTTVELCKIESERIVIYKRLIGYVPKKNKTSFKTQDNTKGKVKGKLSKGAKKHIKNIINLWITSIQFYLLANGQSLVNTRKHIKFITLTLSQKQFTSDEAIKREMLNEFLIIMKRKYKMRNYLWIAETQKNGNLHFHIITDTFINHQTLRSVWNKIQDKNGYLENYNKKFGHKDANSTDINYLKKIHNITAYLTKEATKGQQIRSIEGKLWNCSKNLLELETYENIYNGEINDTLNNMHEKKHLQVYTDKFFSVIFYESYNFFDNIVTELETDLFKHYIKQMDILFMETDKIKENEEKAIKTIKMEVASENYKEYVKQLEIEFEKRK